MELAPDRNPDLQVTVSDPQRHVDPIKDYVSYALNTRTNLSSFASSNFSVRRRYNHFLEFREQLVAVFPAVVVPPLPEKMTTKYLDRFSDTFLEKRRRALEQFMTRLTVHPQLSQSDQLRHFLSEENWVRVDDDKGNSAWMKMSLTGMRNKIKNDPEGNSFENLKNYFIEFHKTLSSIHNLLVSVSKKHQELSELCVSLGESFLALSEQPEPSLEEAIRTLGQVYGQKQSALLAEAATHLDYNTVESLKEYVLIGQTALTVLKYRDGPLGAYLSALSDLTDTKAELLRLQKQQEDPASTKRSAFSSLFSDDPAVKINKLQERVSGEELRLSQTRECLDSTSRSLILEMERLHQYKLKDLRNLLIEFVNGQIDLHKKSAENWEASLSIISNISLTEIAAPSTYGTSSSLPQQSSLEGPSSSPSSTPSMYGQQTFNDYNHEPHHSSVPPTASSSSSEAPSSYSYVDERDSFVNTPVDIDPPTSTDFSAYANPDPQ